MHRIVRHKAVALLVRMMIIAAVVFAAGLQGFSVSFAASTLIQPFVNVTMDGRNAIVDISIRNQGGPHVGLFDIRADIPAGMTFLGATAEGQFLGTQVGWIVTDQGENLSGYQYTVDTNGFAGTFDVTVLAAGGDEDANGTYLASAQIGGATSPAFPTVAIAGQQAQQTTTSFTTGGPIQPLVTAAQDGNIATFSVAIANPSGLRTGVLDIRASVPAGMTFLGATADGQFNGSEVGWISVEQSERLSGFDFTVDTNGNSGTVFVRVTSAGGDANGTFETVTEFAFGGQTTQVATAPETFTTPETAGVAGQQAQQGPATFTGGGPFQPLVTIVPDGNVTRVAVAVSNPDDLRAGVIEIRATVPANMVFLGATAEGQFDGSQVGWIVTEQATFLSGFEFTVDTQGNFGETFITVTTAGSDANGTFTATAPIGVAPTDTTGFDLQSQETGPADVGAGDQSQAPVDTGEETGPADVGF